jgi:peptidoglycan hydrolase CwlO-like protein
MRVVKQSQSETAKNDELLTEVKTLGEALKEKDMAIDGGEKKANSLAKSIDSLKKECRGAKAALEKANAEIRRQSNFSNVTLAPFTQHPFYNLVDSQSQ